ncbi:hypothetical protein SESBI_39158 [Sesbania bispinosa]|nr:hypothetical protein SESBI_39158 [Sesbania bispinosa]
MAKIISFALVYAFVLALPLRSVMCQDDPWQSVISQASQAGISSETLSEAQKAIRDGSAQQVAEEALGDGSSLAIGFKKPNLNLITCVLHSTSFHD